LKQPSSRDGGPSGTFAQATLARLEKTLTKERRKLGRSADVQELVTRELDALTLMLLAEAALLPIALLALDDLLLMVIYAGALSLVAFAMLFLSLHMLERASVQRCARIRSVEDEMIALRRPRNAGGK
jgi:hypothetical protein